MLFSLVDTVAYEEFLGSSHMADHCGLLGGMLTRSSMCINLVS